MRKTTTYPGNHEANQKDFFVSFCLVGSVRKFFSLSDMSCHSVMDRHLMSIPEQEDTNLLDQNFILFFFPFSIYYKICGWIRYTQNKCIQQCLVLVLLLRRRL